MGGAGCARPGPTTICCCSRSTWAPAMAASRAAGTRLREVAEAYAFILTQMGERVTRPSSSMAITARPERHRRARPRQQCRLGALDPGRRDRALGGGRRPGPCRRLCLGRDPARDRLSARRVPGDRIDGADLGRRGAQGRALRPPRRVHRRGRQAASARKTTGRSSTRRSGRPIRVPAEVVAPFLDELKQNAHDTPPAPRLFPLVGRLSRAHRARSQGHRISTATGESGRGRAEGTTVIARSTRRASCRCSRSTGCRLTQSLAIIVYLDQTHPRTAADARDPADGAHVRAMALTIACDIHPLNNLRVLKYLTGELGVARRSATAGTRIG